MRRAAPLPALLLAACTPAPPAEPVEPDTRIASPAQAPAAEALDLFGEWQVAALDTPLLSAEDRRIGDPRRIAVLIGTGSIHASSQCVPFFFRYRRREAERLEVEAVNWPGPVCARGLLPFEAVFDRVVAAVTRLERVPGGVRLAGDAGAVTLRRPPGGLLDNPFGNEPAPGPQLFWGHFRLVEAGGIPAREPIDLAVGQASIEARSSCVSWRWRRDPLGPNLGYTLDPSDLPVCERGLTDVEQALERLLPSVSSLDWVAPYRARLGGPAGAVVLERVVVERN